MWKDREPFWWKVRLGASVCLALAGVVLVAISVHALRHCHPPLCPEDERVDLVVGAVMSFQVVWAGVSLTTWTAMVLQVTGGHPDWDGTMSSHAVFGWYIAGLLFACLGGLSLWFLPLTLLFVPVMIANELWYVRRCRREIAAGDFRRWH